jgi:hypothetical protein
MKVRARCVRASALKQCHRSVRYRFGRRCTHTHTHTHSLTHSPHSLVLSDSHSQRARKVSTASPKAKAPRNTNTKAATTTTPTAPTPTPKQQQQQQQQPQHQHQSNTTTNSNNNRSNNQSVTTNNRSNNNRNTNTKETPTTTARNTQQLLQRRQLQHRSTSSRWSSTRRSWRTSCGRVRGRRTCSWFPFSLRTAKTAQHSQGLRCDDAGHVVRGTVALLINTRVHKEYRAVRTRKRLRCDRMRERLTRIFALPLRSTQVRHAVPQAGGRVGGARAGAGLLRPLR